MIRPLVFSLAIFVWMLPGAIWAQSPKTPSPEAEPAVSNWTWVDAPDATARVQQIKTNPLYREVSGKESNWLIAAFERLRNLNLRLPERDAPRSGVFGGLPQNVSRALITLMWALLAAGVAVFLVFALRHARWRAEQRRRAGMMLDDEPERTRDEWLEEADRLTQAGQYREAVRALYLACLLRIDEARIARFDRSETNWEHLQRIENSARLPEGLDFRPATRLFDVVWYGHRWNGTAEVEQMRSWYVTIGEKVTQVAA